MQEIENNLRGLRKASGLTQGDVAYLIGKETEAYISKIENNKAVPDLRVALLLCCLYNRSIQEIFPQLCSGVEQEMLGKLSCFSDMKERMTPAKEKLVTARMDSIIKKYEDKK